MAHAIGRMFFLVPPVSSSWFRACEAFLHGDGAQTGLATCLRGTNVVVRPKAHGLARYLRSLMEHFGVLVGLEIHMMLLSCKASLVSREDQYL